MTAFKTEAQGGLGVFKNSQHPIIVGQGAYNSAYGSTFRNTAPRDGFVRIQDFSFTFNTLLGQGAGQTLTFPLTQKSIQDEMGEAFEKEYGRMSGNLGLEAPGVVQGQQNLILYPFTNPATEIIDAIELPVGEMEIAPISSAVDGTQLWRITHNGVDTHPIHFHLYDIQLINRVGWDGIIRPPEPSELGWKDTVRVSPLEDTIVALRAIVPKVPFGVPDSIRPLDPMMPLGSSYGFNDTLPDGQPGPEIFNVMTNFGWEYVWHCHILSHEEMDMMRPVSVIVARALPDAPVLSATGDPGNPIALSWTDGTPGTMNVLEWGDMSAEIGYRIERALGGGAFEPLAEALANVTAMTDSTTAPTSSYRYRVIAYNAAGDSVSNEVVVGVVQSPTNLAYTLQFGPLVNLTWTDNAPDETGYVVERSDNGAPFAQLATLAADSTTYSDSTAQPGMSYAYRVLAVKNALLSDPSNEVPVSIPASPAAPTNLTALVQTPNTGARVRIVFTDNANNANSETGFKLQRSDNGGPFADLATLAVRNNTGNVTYFDTAWIPGATHTYQVYAFNATSASAPSNSASVAIPAIPAAPVNFAGVAQVATATTARVVMSWVDDSTTETRFVVQRASDAAFTTNVAHCQPRRQYAELHADGPAARRNALLSHPCRECLWRIGLGEHEPVPHHNALAPLRPCRGACSSAGPIVPNKNAWLLQSQPRIFVWIYPCITHHPPARGARRAPLRSSPSAPTPPRGQSRAPHRDARRARCAAGASSTPPAQSRPAAAAA